MGLAPIYTSAKIPGCSKIQFLDFGTTCLRKGGLTSFKLLPKTQFYRLALM